MIATNNDALLSLIPELFEEAERRYEVLKEVSRQGVVGRRALADSVGLSERIVRTQVEHLERNGLVRVDANGIAITSGGEKVLITLAEYFRERHSLAKSAKNLAEYLGMKEVFIVPGDSSARSGVQATLAQEGALLASSYLHDRAVVAVSGGTTMALLANALPEQEVEITVVPARGGFGEHLESQANVVAARFAGKTGGHYRMLHVPDGFSKEVVDLLRREDAGLREVEHLIQHADLLILGIGEAGQMADRRQLTEEEREQISSRGAVGEALGYYANPAGEIVYRRYNVGLTPEELGQVPEVIIVAGGKQKAAAIAAMAKAGVRGRLVTDEGAAKAILAKYKEEK